MAEIVPTHKKKLRACMLCGLIKSETQFKATGCENCEEILQLQGSGNNIADCTSRTFDGVIAMMKPQDSWVAKWQRGSKFVPGLYAIRISGRLPDEIVNELADRNIMYRPRDGSEILPIVVPE